MNKEVQFDRLTVEALMESYSKEELLQISRFCLVNDVQVLTIPDLDRAISLDKDSPELDYFYRLPKHIKAPLTKHYSTTDFDCPCTNHCNITEISKVIIRALHHIRTKFKEPITIVKGYECTTQGDDTHSIQHTKGCALTLQSSDNERLYALIDKGKYSHYSLGRCDNFIYLNLRTRKDQHGNVTPDGPRFDLRIK